MVTGSEQTPLAIGSPEISYQIGRQQDSSPIYERRGYSASGNGLTKIAIPIRVVKLMLLSGRVDSQQMSDIQCI